MAHMILGDRFMSRSQVAWHGLGEVFDENVKISASQAVKKVAGDVVVTAQPLWYRDTDGNDVEMKDYFAIVRNALTDDGKPKVLGVRTEQWVSIPYVQLAQALDELSKTYRVETAGLIQDGAMCFLALKGPDFGVKGDRMQDYFIANLSQTPGVSHKIMASPVRVVCFNTNLMAEEQASISLKIPHSAKAKERIALAGTLVAQFKSITSKSREVFDLFASTKITNANLDKLLKAAWPDPEMPSEMKLFKQALASQEEGLLKQALGPRFAQVMKAQESFDRNVNRVSELRQVGRERFDAFEPAKLRGTVWAAYNAVTEVADWREGRGADMSSVWGGRAREKQAAFSEALQMLK